MKKLPFLKIPLTNFTKMIFFFTNPSQWKIHTVAIFIRIIYIKIYQLHLLAIIKTIQIIPIPKIAL